MHKIKRIHIEISTMCNSQCITCPQSFIKRPKLIDVERVKRLITEDCLVYRDSLTVFEFHNYNEPFLTFELFYELALLVNEVYGKEKVGVVTNGSVMSEEIANKLLDLNLAYLYFSLDGLSKEVFEAHRVGLEYETVYRNVLFFIKRCEALYFLTGEALSPYVSFVITPRNQHEIEGFKQFFANRWCRVSFQDCDGRGGRMGKEDCLHIISSEQECDYAMDGVYVLSNLDVVPCCEDWEGIEVMGNLKAQTLTEIVNGERYNDFRLKQTTGRKKEIPLCRDCKTNMIYNYPRSFLKRGD